MHTSNDNARGLSSVAKALWRENGEPHVVEQKLTVGQKELRLLVCTFNVGNAPLNQTELCHWLPVEENEYDLIAIGLQESTYNNRSSINKGSRAFDSGTLRAASFVANEGAAYPSSRSLSLRAGLPRSLSSDGSLGDPLEDLASPVSGSTDTDTRGVGSSHPSTCEPQSVALMFDDSDEDRSGALHTTPRTSHKALNDGLSPMSSPRKNRPSSISQSLRKTRKRGGAERLKMLVRTSISWLALMFSPSCVPCRSFYSSHYTATPRWATTSETAILCLHPAGGCRCGFEYTYMSQDAANVVLMQQKWVAKTLA
jgi:hypothetical protein